MKGVIKYKKKPSSIRNHVLHGHAKKFTSILALIELRKTSHPEYASEISTDDGSRKRGNADEVSVGGTFSDYLLLCDTYGENNPKQREFEGNVISSMAHAFTLMSLVEHDFFRNLTQDIDPRLHPVGISKMSRSIIPT